MSDDSLFRRFDQQVERRGQAIALSAEDGTSLTYIELRDCAARFASLIRQHGVVPGDRIVVQVEKSVDAVALYLACLQTGTIFVPLNTANTQAEVSYFIDDANPALFIHEGSWADLRVQAVAAVPDFTITASTGDGIAAICYTSGTTGRSKGAMLSHANLLSNAETLIELWRFTPGDRLLHILPIFHVHGLFVALHCALMSGASILFETGFDVARVRALLPKATVMMGVPTHYTRLLADPGFGAEDCASIRLFLCGSAPLLAETHTVFEARTGQRILERYGMTEAGMITSNPYDGVRIAGTVGFPLRGVSVRLGDVDGGVGTLEIKGPNVTSGYWHMPDTSAESFTGDGWFITGDLATMADDGRITIVGRAKDLIIAGGFNIYPKEVECVIDEMPGVAESAVVGVPHLDFGESIVAVIVADAGVTEADVAAWVKDRLARFKHPRTVHFVDNLPRNTMGKVQKAELRARFG